MLAGQLMVKERAAEHHRIVETGGSLTLFSSFGTGPLADHLNLQLQRSAEFHWKCNFEDIFSDIQQNNVTSFRFSIQLFLNISHALTQA